MINTKILVLGQKQFNLYDRSFVLFEFNKIINKLKSESNVFVYSGLLEGSELLLAYEAVKNKVATIGCIPFRNFQFKFSPTNQKVYRSVVPRLHSFTVISNTYSYKAYSKRADYFKLQCNSAVCVWNGKEGHTKITLNSLVRSWRGKKYPIYIIDYVLHTTSLINT